MAATQTTKNAYPPHHNERIVWSREDAPSKRQQEECHGSHELKWCDRHFDEQEDFEQQKHHRTSYHERQQQYIHDEVTDEMEDIRADELHQADEDSLTYSDTFNIEENFYGHFDINQVQCPPSLFDEYDTDDEYVVQQVQEPIQISKEVQNENGYSSQIEFQSNKPLFERYEEYSSQDVIHRIEVVIAHLVNYLAKLEGPILHEYKNPPVDEEDDASADDSISSSFFAEIIKYNSSPFKQFDNVARQRLFTSVVLIMSFIHGLLLSNRTTTTREVYYVYVTHFRSQKECDSAILDVARCLGVPRRALGLSASPKGWFCGSLEITRKGTIPSGKDISGSTDGTALSSIQGLPITREWIDRDKNGFTEEGVEIKVSSKDARVIVVIEKEGVYNRLAEERIFDTFPCILVTGKGFPDLATRALVQSLHKELDLPVVGLCDANPFGISVLSTFYCAGDRMGIDGNMNYSVPIRWIGLRPSTVADLEDQLPKEVFQKLTDRDYKRIDALLDKTHSFWSEDREEEILAMKEAGYKCELEALYWLGPDYMGDWVVQQLESVDDESEWDRVAI